MSSKEDLVKKFPALQYFEYEHLPEHLKEISQEFAKLALEMADKCPANAETSAGLRKLLEAKDCFVRANLSIELT